jgi:hypothetical protein
MWVGEEYRHVEIEDRDLQDGTVCTEVGWKIQRCGPRTAVAVPLD